MRHFAFIIFFFTATATLYGQFHLPKDDGVENTNRALAAANTFAYPQSIFVDSPNGHIWVTDFDNNRVLRFDVSFFTSAKELQSVVFPKIMFLSQNYPNPFNPITQITFSVSTTGSTSLILYNLLGQVVGTMFNEIAIAGTQYSFSFDAKNLPSGIYIYALRSSNGIEVKRMCLLK